MLRNHLNTRLSMRTRRSITRTRLSIIHTRHSTSRSTRARRAGWTRLWLRPTSVPTRRPRRSTSRCMDCQCYRPRPIGRRLSVGCTTPSRCIMRHQCRFMRHRRSLLTIRPHPRRPLIAIRTIGSRLLHLPRVRNIRNL